MRMSDKADTDTMKVSEADDTTSHRKDNAIRSSVSEKGDKEEPVSINAMDNKEDFLLTVLEKEDGATQEQAEKEVCYDKANKADKNQRKVLSRDSSQDYTDSTGIDLHEFLVNTLKSNPRDRIMLLKLEQDILDFIGNNESQKRTFPPMTSYHRMLLHRVAAYFGMDHNVDLTGKSVVINKTTSTRIPDQKFSEHIKDDRADDFQKRYILKRDNSSFDRDDSAIRMRLKADKKSKSMEEREEEYQRARERIFAHDGDHFILDRSAQDEDASMRTQQRRQMFRSRAGRSGASWQSSSETEMLPRHGEPRPWSSTDSSDSSNRLALRPAITKASSFSGISRSLVRGDSTASSKSTGRLSKTGSESCSSVGSSSSSLSRPHRPFTVPASSRPKIPGEPLIYPAADTKGSTLSNIIRSAPLQPTPSTDATNYYVLSLEASGIPPGSVLLNPHTGKTFIHPGSSGKAYSTASVAPPAGRGQHQGKLAAHQLTSATCQQQQANQLHSQPTCPPFQPSSDAVHNPTVSYHLPPPQFLPVCPNQQYTVLDSLNTQFSRMTLAQQSANSGAPAADARHYAAVYHHPGSVVLQGAASQQVANYMVAGSSGGHPGMLQGQPVPLPTPGPNHAYPSSMPGHAAFPASSLSQQHTSVLPQHTYIHQPIQQMPSCYCSSTHHPQCSNQQQQPPPNYRPPVNPLAYNGPYSQNLPQQQVPQPVMTSPVSSYQTVVGVQQTPNFALTGPQQSNIGSQMQGMVVQYSPVQSYQVSVPHQTHQQPMFVACQPGQGAVAIAGMQPCYSLLPPTNQHTTMSSTVSFLPSPMMEQLPFPHNSPCVAQQNQGQQYTAGLLPPTPGSGMVMLQMAAPSCQQPRASSPCQQKQPSYKHLGLEHQRSHRTTERSPPNDNTQSSPPPSPALTPSPGQSPSIKGLSTGISSIPVMAHQHQLQLPTAFCPSGQGEAHYSLLGQPLQYKHSIRPPLIHTAHILAKHQGPIGVWRSGHGRKASRKSLPSDHSVGEAGNVTSRGRLELIKHCGYFAVLPPQHRHAHVND